MKKKSKNFDTLDIALAKQLYRPRNPESHKGTYGHGLLVAGSYGKMGAALLSASACLRSGVGLLTCHIPKCGYDILQSQVPEAMVLADFNSSFLTAVEDDLEKYKAVGVGPGLGTANETAGMLRLLIEKLDKPMVIDADALNILSKHPDWLQQLPAYSILTPHPKEFARLFGETTDDNERVERALEKSRELNCIIILKGHHTLVALPNGKGYFNTTGNAGMASGGIGDVLTGMLTALLCQGYSPDEAARLGVFLHGLAGDLAAASISQEALIASDLIGHIGQAFLHLQSAVAKI